VDPRWYTTFGYSNSQDNDMTIMTILPHCGARTQYYVWT